MFRCFPPSLRRLRRTADMFKAYRRHNGEPLVQTEQRASQSMSVSFFPSFQPPLCSRPFSVFLLERLSDEQIVEILTKAVARVGPPTDTDAATEDPSSSPSAPSSSSQPTLCSQPSTGSYDHPFSAYPHLTRQIISSIASLSTGDARTALSLLELVLCSPPTIPEDVLLSTLRKSVSASYDRTGDSRYEMISALHKSVRGSQPDAAMYWLARMLEAGEDPLYIARRMTVCASEDIGLADPHALPLVRLFHLPRPSTN